MQQQLLDIDDFIAYQAGTHIIKLTWTNHGVYNVTVHDGIQEVEGLGGPFASEAEARLVARGYAQMFNAEHAAKQQAPATLDMFRQTHRATPTRSRVHCKPLTAAELSLVRNHRSGVVTTRPGQPWTMLQAIHQRIGGERTYRPGTRIIASLRLTDEQLAVAA